MTSCLLLRFFLLLLRPEAYNPEPSYLKDVADGFAKKFPPACTSSAQRKLKQQTAGAEKKRKKDAGQAKDAFYIKKHARKGKDGIPIVQYAINQRGDGPGAKDKQIVQCLDFDICSIVLAKLNKGKISAQQAIAQINSWKADKTLPEPLDPNEP